MYCILNGKFWAGSVRFRGISSPVGRKETRLLAQVFGIGVVGDAVPVVPRNRESRAVLYYYWVILGRFYSTLIEMYLGSSPVGRKETRHSLCMLLDYRGLGWLVVLPCQETARGGICTVLSVCDFEPVLLFCFEMSLRLGSC